MRASYMEIYNERIYDLLNKEDRHLKLQETPVCASVLEVLSSSPTENVEIY